MIAPAADARRLAVVSLLMALVAAVTGFAARPPDAVTFNAGGVVGGVLGEGWSESNRTSLDPEVGALDPSPGDEGRPFRFRAVRPGGALDLPFAPREGPLQLALFTMARVRTLVSFHVDGQPAADVNVPRGPWKRYELELPVPAGASGVAARLALRPLPLVRVPDEYMAQPIVWVADVELSAPAGLRFSLDARVALGAVPLLVASFGLAVGAGSRGALVAALIAAAATVVLARTAPVPLLAAVPRLLSPALAAGLAACVALRAARVASRARAALSALVAAGIVAHASLAFLPGYDPYDMEVHVRRARDLGSVPLQYDALLRYGSHLPTLTQTFGTATAALGEATLIPYSPLPYAAYYALHRLGLDLHWAMTVLDATLGMLVAPALWWLGSRVWGAGAGWIAASLFTLELPLWHHLARAHVPAVFGAALGTAVLLFLAGNAADLGGWRRASAAALMLALAALGYSSQVVLLGLFGLALLTLLMLDAAGLTAAARRGVAGALVGGGLLSGVLFYFHYLPALLHGLGPLQAEPDLFQPRTYLIFHNESRQSMRVWAAGFGVPLAAGLLAAPFALRSARPAARPVLAAWLAAWPMIMLAKEPFLFPRPLRWAKEEQFIAPLLALFIGAVAWGLPRPWMRWAAATLAVGAAAWLQLGDFLVHATGSTP